MLDWFPLQQSNFTLSTAIAIMLTSLALDLYPGELEWWRNQLSPQHQAVKFIRFLEPKLNRAERGKAIRIIRGVILTMMLACLAVLVGFLLQFLSRTIVYGWVLEAIALVNFIQQRAPIARLFYLNRILRTGDLQTARHILYQLLNQDSSDLDTFGVARIGTQIAAQNFGDHVVAPLFWYVIGGLPLLFLYGCVSAAAQVQGSLPSDGVNFNSATVHLNRLLSAVPAWIAGTLLALACPYVPGTSLLRAFMMMQYCKRYGQPTVAALAGACDFALGGPRRIAGQLYNQSWIGVGRARIVPKDLRRAGLLLITAGLLNLVLVCGLLLLRILWFEAK